MDRQLFGNALGGEVVLAAGEAMRKQRIGHRRPERHIERGGELLAFRIQEIKAGAAPVSYTHLDVYKRQDPRPGGALRRRA